MDDALADRLSCSGLTSEEAEQRLADTGANLPPAPTPRRLLARILAQLLDPMLILLGAAGAFTIAIGDAADATIIAAVVIFNTAAGVIQEVRAERAVAAVGSLVASSARVVRDGVPGEVPASAVVPGDLVVLAAGDVVPADAVAVSVHDLEIDQSVMTGESVPVVVCPGRELWGGTVVTHGRGTAAVTLTGPRSGVGRIAALIASTQLRATPLQRRLAQLSRLLVLLVLALTGLVVLQGLATNRPMTDMALIGVSLAVAAVPESLPAVVAVALALGAGRMARRNAVVRRLLAVETLGSVTVIATDKTGTLTEGRMVIERSWTAEGSADSERRLLRDVVLCNDADVDAGGVAVGDPVETALLLLAREHGVWPAVERQQWPRVGEEPFDHALRRMRTSHRSGDGSCLVVEKGAPEVIFALVGEGATTTLARAETEKMARAGLRVLAVAEHCIDTGGATTGPHLVGVVGIGDPLRPEAAGVVAACHHAGIDVVLVTGDHPGTARAIASAVGIDAATSVHARVRPEAKLGIVERLQSRGEVVAMLGDGVNDGPALRRADIGVAAGRSGSEVARQAADLVLLDDDFRSVVSAIEEGRRIYANICSFLVYAVSGGLAEVAVMLVAPLVGIAQPLVPAQILWINLMTHGLTGVAFGADPADPSGMTEPPRRPAEPIFTRSRTALLVVAATLLTVTSIVVGVRGSDTERSSMIFLCLGVGQLGVALAVRARPGRGTGRNFALLVAVAGSALLMLAAVEVAPLRSLLGTIALGPQALTLSLLCAAVPGLVLGSLVRSMRTRKLVASTNRAVEGLPGR